jgi:methionyl-tRNA formyltransferase
VRRERLRIVLFGYHTIGYLCLRELLERDEEVCAVVTHVDDPGEHIWFESVAGLARAAGIPVLTPESPNTAECVHVIRSLHPDLILSCYYRRLLGKTLLAIPPLGGVNLHGSLLPKYRGRAPVNWVLVNGETQTGVTLHHMTEEPDAGDIIAQRPVDIAFEDTALTLFNKVSQAALDLFRATLPLIKAGVAPRLPQDPAQATYFGGRTPEDGRLDWDRPALDLYNLVRAVTTPYPGAFTFLHRKRLHVWSSGLTPDGKVGRWPPGTILGTQDEGCQVATRRGSLLLTQVQLQGEEIISGKALMRKHGLKAGMRLGEGQA